MIPPASPAPGDPLANVFLASAAVPRPVRSLAGEPRLSESPPARLSELLAPLRARLPRPGHDGHAHLVVQPLRPRDAVPAFCHDPGAADHVLVVGDGDGLMDLASIAARHEVTVVEVLGDDRLVLDVLGAARLLSLPALPSLLAVRIEGPLEAADADAIERAWRAGGNPLEAELRATLALESRPGTALDVRARDRRDALRVAAEGFRQYLAAIRRRPVAEVAPPEVGLLEPLFAPSGEILVRPIETEQYSTAIDVGVAAGDPDRPGPASHSLIYDLHSNTWHGE